MNADKPLASKVTKLDKKRGQWGSGYGKQYESWTWREACAAIPSGMSLGWHRAQWINSLMLRPWDPELALRVPPRLGGIGSPQRLSKSEPLILRILIFANRLFAGIIKTSWSGRGRHAAGLMSLWDQGRPWCHRGEDSFGKDSRGRDWSEACNNPGGARAASRKLEEVRDFRRNLDSLPARWVLASGTDLCCLSPAVSGTCPYGLRQTTQRVPPSPRGLSERSVCKLHSALGIARVVRALPEVANGLSDFA